MYIYAAGLDRNMVIAQVSSDTIIAVVIILYVNHIDWFIDYIYREFIVMVY